MPVIAIPKTMDNDVQGTEYCIGFSTAITRAKELITRQRTTLGSHERIGVFRIFGRDAGFTALYTAYVTSTRCLIPEYPFDVDRVAKILSDDKRNNPSHYALVIVSEGAVWKEGSVKEYGEADAYGHRKKVDIGQALGDEIRRRTGDEIMVSDLTYDLRSGEPDAIDQLVAITFANIAVDMLRDGVTGRMVGVLLFFSIASESARGSFTVPCRGAALLRPSSVRSQMLEASFRPTLTKRSCRVITLPQLRPSLHLFSWEYNLEANPFEKRTAPHAPLHLHRQRRTHRAEERSAHRHSR